MACRFERWQRAGHQSPPFSQTLFDSFSSQFLSVFFEVFFCARSMVRDAHPNLVLIFGLVLVHRTEISHPVL
ncbi:hypothetical protein PspLS_02261 [Pyricularia sp. CBS 133598]|nr:hypothetical protein PspLS_02261 [Pyricularia sp. CBS 133598]